jgi:ParB-like chromosome segregation protein Spo0J
MAADKLNGLDKILALVAEDEPLPIRVPIDAIAPVERLSPRVLERVARTIQAVKAGAAFKPVQVLQGWNGFEVVAGRHLLEAARRLGHTEVDVIVVSGLDDLIEQIDENLYRADLSAAEIAEHMARRKKLWERKRQGLGSDSQQEKGSAASSGEVQVVQVAPPEFGYKRPPPQSKGFAAETAEKTGRDKSTITRALARSKKVAPDVIQAVKRTPLDSGSSLDKLAKLPVEQQRQAAKSGILPLELPPTKPPADPAKMSAHAEIIGILRRHIPLEERGRLLTLAVGLPVGTAFAMIIRAAQGEGDAG